MCCEGKKLKNFSESWRRLTEPRPREIKAPRGTVLQTNTATAERRVAAEARAARAVAAEAEEGAGPAVEHAAAVVGKVGLAADRAVVVAIARGPRVAQGVGAVVTVMGGARRAPRVNHA